jgi:hypothetical protein
MSNNAYPVGSIYRSRDIWESLPRQDVGTARIGPPRLFIGCFWALAIEVGVALIGWLLWGLSR